MVRASARSTLADAAIATAASYAIFAGIPALHRGDVYDLLKAALFFAFAVVGPLIAIAAFWYAVPALAAFALLGVLAARKIRTRAIRITAFLALSLLWLIYGMRCFLLVTGGA